MRNHFSTGINVKGYLEEHRPSVIVELGAASGENTKNLLGYVIENKAELIVISDNPCEIKEEGFKYIQGLSYKELQTCPQIDCCILDTDHNYWTLNKELIELKKKMSVDGLIFIHDTESYGRKGGYAEMYGTGEHYPKEEICLSIEKGLMDAIEKNLDVFEIVDRTEDSCGCVVLRRVA